MLNKQLVILISLIFITFPGSRLSTAGDAGQGCTRLDDKAAGELSKYSLDADVNGPVFFSGISCAIQYRNKELCAMEMISFDTTSKVYDYYSGEKIEAAKAYFWSDDRNGTAAILAFSSKEAAEKYAAEQKAGQVLDFTGLTEKMLK